MDSVLGVFAKEPRPGHAKSRLAAAMGNEAAAELYAAFLSDLLARFDSIPVLRVIAFTPATAKPFFHELVGNAFELVPQVEGDLGARMSQFFQTQFERGARRVVLIGSDTPHLSVPRVEQAFESLDRHRLVLGPSDDGGYYLVGMSQLTPEIFQQIEWSSPRVLQQTLARAASFKIEPKLLDPMYDVDRPEDLKRLVEYIAAERSAGRDHGLARTAQFAARLGFT